jgi:cell division septal protein FtsQ
VGGGAGAATNFARVDIAAGVDNALLIRRRALQKARGRRRLMMVVALATVLGSIGGYKLLAASSAFRVTGVQVQGAGSAALRQEITGSVESATAGKSLLAVDAGSLARSLERLPYIRAATVDRAFPHTLRVSVETYRPVIYAQSGRTGWLIAADGRVLEQTSTPPRRAAVVSIPAGLPLTPGERTGDVDITSALSLLRLRPPSFGRRVGPITKLITRSGTITAVVGTHIQIRFGESTDLPVKLAVIARVLPLINGHQRHDLAYVDVSAPGRPALGWRTTKLSSSTLG